MTNDEQIVDILGSFEVDRLLKLMALHARKKHDGHFSVFSFTTGYKAAFGTPDMDSGGGRVQLLKIKSHSRIKDALVESLALEKTFFDHWDGDYQEYMAALIREIDE